MAYSKSRNPNHDYRSRCIYLITINKMEGMPAFSSIAPKKAPAAAPGSAQSGAAGLAQKAQTVKAAAIAAARNGAKVILTPAGKAIKKQILLIPELFPEARILQFVVMPDHIHFVIDIQKPTDYHLGTLIGNFKGACSREACVATIFEDGYHDRILRSKGQLKRMIHYVKVNPSRRLITKAGNEFFYNSHILHLWGKNYVVSGNFLLLRNPVMSAVRFSSKFSATELAERERDYAETLRSAGVFVSPFIHDEEKRVMRQAAKEGASLILICRDEIGERYKPAGEELGQLCAQGRLLVISTQIAALGGKLTREEAQTMNALAERIASGSLPELKLRPRPQGGTSGHARRASQSHAQSGAPGPQGCSSVAPGKAQAGAVGVKAPTAAPGSFAPGQQRSACGARSGSQSHAQSGALGPQGCSSVAPGKAQAGAVGAQSHTGAEEAEAVPVKRNFKHNSKIN